MWYLRSSLAARRSWAGSVCMCIYLLVRCSAAASPRLTQSSHVCVVTCDFWGLPAAGGTATAYHHLATSLTSSKGRRWPVTFMAATYQYDVCRQAKRQLATSSIDFQCLMPHHFQPEVATSFPYESIGVALVKWLKTDGQVCDVVHAHEWGGGMQQLAAFIATRPKPGLRLVIEPHGGHYWSTQGMRQRPTDLFTLRVDDHERLTLQLADEVKSPSAYMLAYFRQRGWRLPKQSSVIPNIVPDAHASAEERKSKAVWRVAFFGRLEERKGLKIFCEAVEMLNVTSPKFEIAFIGGEAQVNMIPSLEYLRDRTKDWKMLVNIQGSLPRLTALRQLKQDGWMVVFPSMVENLPFTVAEACLEGIPFVTFNVGGVSEVADPAFHSDVYVSNMSAQAVSVRINDVLHQGWLQTSVLSPDVRKGEQLWRDWHTQFDLLKQARISRDIEIRTAPFAAMTTIKLKKKQSFRSLQQTVCEGFDVHEALLLVPDEYSMPDRQDLPKLEYLATQLTRLQAENFVGSLVFGAVLPSGKLAYPSNPTWIVYQGNEALCVEDSPLLLLTQTFCSANFVEAHDFELFQTWVMIHHLRMLGLATSTMPEPLFILDQFSREGVGCVPDQLPEFRMLPGHVAANLLGTPEDVLLVQHLAPWPQPVASFRSAFGMHQGHNGWHYFYLDDSGEHRILKWFSAASNLTYDGKWTCEGNNQAYVGKMTMHPCATDLYECCNTRVVAAGVKYLSSFWDMAALVEITYEVWPCCGDGLRIEVILIHGSRSNMLYSRSYLVSESPPHRETVEKITPIVPGDFIMVLVHPNDDHDCDGVYIEDIKVWSSNSAEGLHA